MSTKFTSEQEDALLKSLYQDKQILSFLENHKLDFDFLKKNASMFLMYRDTLTKCIHCPGLASCTQPIQGKYKSLQLDEQGYLVQNFVSCQYLESIEKKRKHRDNFRLSYLTGREYEIDPGELAKGQSAQYLLSFKALLNSVSNEKGVYLYGQPGVGKTYMCIGIANYYAKEGKKVSFVKIPGLVAELKQTMLDTDHRKKVMNDLRYSDIVFLDDLGAEAISAWTRDEILLPILEYRMNHRSKTYITSNYGLKELEKQYTVKNDPNSRIGALRILERIRALCEICNLLGESKR